MSINQLRYWVKKIAKRSEVTTNVYPHRWRHSMATKMMDNGAPLEVIAANLGHARISTTMIYAQLSGERRRQEYNKYFR
jgi:integrase/recombinase XerD